MEMNNLVLTSISIILGGFISYVFHRIHKKESNTANKERALRVREELVNIIESYIINKKVLTVDIIKHLISAAERDYKVSLSEVTDAKSLLQIVLLRLNQSKHLDINEKEEYAKTITKLLDYYKETERDVDEIIQEIEEAIKQQNYDAILGITPKLRDSFNSTKNKVIDVTKSLILLTSLGISILFVIITFILFLTVTSRLQILLIYGGIAAGLLIGSILGLKSSNKSKKK